MPTITEHSSTINATLPKGDVTAKMEVFYNPVMVSNRNISILLLNAITNKNMRIALPLAGSGIRALRFAQEIKKGKIKEIHINDKKPNFTQTFAENLELNNNPKNIVIHNQDANLFLQTSEGFDYIDIDPFGSPNPFLSAAVAAISRNGVLAITATDTAALTGTYPKVTKRKYWAKNQRSPLMHEVGLRILIRKIQLQGVQFDKALTPILAYHKDHYFRVYFRCEKGKQKCDAILKQHQYFLLNSKTLEFTTSQYNQEEDFNTFFGPLWAGSLQNKPLLKKMLKNNLFEEEQKFLQLLTDEKDIVGFYDLHAIAKKHKKMPPKMEITLKKLNATRTHFSKDAIKTTKSIKDVALLLQIKN